MYGKTLASNVRLASVTRKSCNGKFTAKIHFPMGHFIIALSLHPVCGMRSLETSWGKITYCGVKDVEVSLLSKIQTCFVFIFALFSAFLCTTIVSFQKSMLVNPFICGNIITPPLEPEFSFPKHALRLWQVKGTNHQQERRTLLGLWR